MRKEIGGVNQYIFTHGKRPFGKGTWAFKGDDGKVTFISGRYSEAKKQALKKIKNPVLQT
ncbi:MAG: hypothetical protein KKH94_09570 [Candidatus Omnitrophica bacterium]|nr:hypothetical protein [Candidatus Omnitrophota bacterium]